ncbi:MAG: hypothetical protein JSS20_09430 [Proteobacteria bacterium]|nr:hypothetical protein [Pseudomonadota bacterium]
MDLQTATQMSGRKGRLARIGTLVFLSLACGLLVSSLLHVGRGNGEAEQPVQRRVL